MDGVVVKGSRAFSSAGRSCFRSEPYTPTTVVCGTVLSGCNGRVIEKTLPGKWMVGCGLDGVSAVEVSIAIPLQVEGDEYAMCIPSPSAVCTYWPTLQGSVGLNSVTIRIAGSGCSACREACHLCGVMLGPPMLIVVISSGGEGVLDRGCWLVVV